MGKKQDLSKRRMEALRRGDLETADKLLRELMPRQRRDQEAHDLEKEALRARRSKKLRDWNTYDVVAGDSFFSVAGDVLGDARLAGALIEANPNVYVLHPGMVLDLPELDTEADEPPLFSEEAYRDALISQELVDAIGGDPSGARVGDEDVEVEVDKEFVQDSQEALMGLGMEEEALAEVVADLLINLGYTDVPVPKVMEMPAAQEEEDIDEERFDGPDLETEEYLEADISLEDGAQLEETPPPPDDGGRHGGAKVEGKGIPEVEPAVVPTEEVEPTEIVDGPLPSYEELVIAEETNWPQWENALGNSGIELRDDEGELNIEAISTYIAEDIEANKERYAQELGMTVDELGEVSKERVEIWLEAAELHGQLDVFNTSLLLKQNDQDIFGVTISAAGFDLDEYDERLVPPVSEPFLQKTRENISRGFVTLAFALARVDSLGRSPNEVFRAVFAEGINIEFDPKYDEDGKPGLDTGGCINTGDGFRCDSDELVGGSTSMDFQLIAHEFAHVLESRISANVLDGLASTQTEYQRRLAFLMPRGVLDSTVIRDANGELIAGQGLPRNEEAFVLEDGLQTPWQQHGTAYFDDANETHEEIGDIFVNWIFSSFKDNEAGTALYNWCDELMPIWIQYATEEYDSSWIDQEIERRAEDENN